MSGLLESLMAGLAEDGLDDGRLVSVEKDRFGSWTVFVGGADGIYVQNPTAAGAVADALAAIRARKEQACGSR